MGLGLSGLRLGLGQRGGGGLRVNFYVDSVGGSDANDGLTDATAFQTLGAAETAALAYGDGVTVGLVAGSEWREDLDLSTLTGATVIGVGDLATDGLPVIDGALVYEGSYDDATARGDGLTNVWSFEVTQTEVGGYQSIWVDGQKLNWVASAAAVTPGDFYVSNTGTDNKNQAGTNTIYFRLPGDADPTGAVIEYSDPTRRGAVNIGTNGRAKFIHTKRNFHADGSFKAAFGGLAENCLFNDGVKHESLMGSGTYRACVGWHTVSDARTNNIVIEFYASDGTGESCTYTGCAVVGPGAEATQAVVAFSGHNQGAGTYYKSVALKDCSARDCATLGGMEAQESLIAERLWADNCSNGMNGTIGNGSESTIKDFQYTAVGGVVKDARVFTLGSAYRVEGLRAYIEGLDNTDGIDFTAQDVTIDRSVIVFDSPGWSSGFWTGASSGRTINVTNSIIQNVGDKVTFFSWYTEGAQVLGTLGNNVYHDAVNGGANIQFRVSGTSYASISAYLTALPESGTVQADPGLVDPAGFDFSLTAPLANGAGLERFPTYTPIPASLAAAEAWILS